MRSTSLKQSFALQQLDDASGVVLSLRRRDAGVPMSQEAFELAVADPLVRVQPHR